MVTWTLLLIAGLWALAYFQANRVQWTVGILVLLVLGELMTDASLFLLWLLYLAGAVLLNASQLRQSLITEKLLAWFRRVLPPISDTEREAIDAGSVWWDGEIFRGQPDWDRLLDTSLPGLTPEEQDFLDGPTEELCQRLNDWQITQELNDLPTEIWDFLKQHRFFGMIIPKDYGGLGFSARAHSEVVMKISTRSLTAGVTVMVPNSLGPGELLLHYGTDEQKQHYLPRLATGEEIPCFALTSPYAGSDAGAIPDYGILCEQEYNGKKTLGFRLTWEKRYITLAPVATVLGLAFRALDPQRLLGGEEDLGITCALIPTTTPGVEIGNRHYPLTCAFQNGPTRGKDVFVPVDWVIGGQERIGQGWMMLMNSLAAGRSISLPALSTGAAKLSCRYVGAYARVRNQFRLPIAKFEGVEEILGAMAGTTYRMDSARILTAGALDLGEKPSVLSGVLKYSLTEDMRVVINQAMDILGGRGICVGPHNFLGRVYEAIPISITVEGANILTRSLMVFGQGAIRSHPFVLREMEAAADDNQQRALHNFEALLGEHIRLSMSNAAKTLFMGLTYAALGPAPRGDSTAAYYRRLNRLHAAFAFLADVAMIRLGGGLKRKEKLSGRFADAFSHLYLAAATLKRFEDDGSPSQDRPLLEWALEDSLHKIESRLHDILRNLPSVWLRVLLRPVILPLGRREQGPSDQLSRAAAKLLQKPGESRDRLTQGAYWTGDPQDSLGLVEHTLRLVLQAEPLEHKLAQALNMKINETNYEEALAQGLERNLIQAAQAETIRHAMEAVRQVIQVDEFPPQTFGRALEPLQPERFI